MKSFKAKIAFFLARVHLFIYQLFGKSLSIRKGTTDFQVYKDILVFGELKLELDFEPKYIVDGGAYAGFSSYFFANRYKGAMVLAIEPEKSNFDRLLINTKSFRNIIQLRKGLFYKNCYLKIIDRRSGKWGFMVEEVSENQTYDVEAIDINTLIEKFDFPRIDILKLDIEGAEKQIFLKNSQWIQRTNIIIVETHDRFVPGCSDAIEAVLDTHYFEKRKKGEKLIYIRRKTIQT